MIPKYRAWGKATGKMFGVRSISWVYDEDDCYFPGDIDSVVIVDIDENTEYTYYGDEIKSLILIQSTGLKDKNGVEIFKGDIVKRKDNRVGVIRWDIRYAMFVLSFKPQTLDNLYGAEEAIIFHEAEIIGNKWANPELLPQEPDDG